MQLDSRILRYFLLNLCVGKRVKEIWSGILLEFIKQRRLQAGSVNGEYVRDFKDLSVRVYDISAFNALEVPVDDVKDVKVKPVRRAENASETKPAQYVSKVDYAGGTHDEGFVRPCMQVTADTDIFSSRKREWIRSIETST